MKKKYITYSTEKTSNGKRLFDGSLIPRNR